MALRFLEGFEGINDASKYITSTSGGLDASFPGRVSGSAESVVRGTFKTPSLGADQSEWYVGFGLYAESGQINTNSSVYFQLSNGSLTKVTVEIRWDGSKFILLVYIGPLGAPVSLTYNLNGAQPFMSADQWYFFEFYVNFAGGSESFQIRKDGEATAFYSPNLNFNPAPLSANNFAWHSETGWHLDDIRVLDGSGTENNTWLGPQQIVGFQPNSVGASNDWDNVGGALTKVLAVTDGQDNTFLEADTINESQLFNSTDVSSLVGTIYGVQIENKLRVSGIGTRDVRLIGREGVTTYDWGDVFTVSDTSPITYFEVQETSPDGGVWSLSAINNMQFGLKVVD